jgi:hypothetical protein
MAVEKRRLVLSRPKDETFESYLAWIKSTYQVMSDKPADEMDEEKLRQDWLKFWGKSEDETPQPEPPVRPR